MSLSFQPNASENLEIPGTEGAEDSTSHWYPGCKEIGDRIVAALMLVLLAPLLVVLMALVCLTSPGLAIYKQRRLGRGAKPFFIYKLRSMRNDCEKLTGPQWASKKGDPRVTRLGRFLRRSHLDELPQLWNVLRGDMSLVGPRPERPEFVAKLERLIPDYCDRMEVYPGITGLAQVQLPADEEVDDVRRKVQCDLCYIRNLGPWLDFKILVGTVLKVAGVPLSVTGRILKLPGRVGPDPRDQIETKDPLQAARCDVALDLPMTSR